MYMSHPQTLEVSVALMQKQEDAIRLSTPEYDDSSTDDYMKRD